MESGSEISLLPNNSTAVVFVSTTPSDSQYKQGFDYSEYKQGLADIARKGPLGHGRCRTLLAYDQISHWRDLKKKNRSTGGEGALSSPGWRYGGNLAGSYPATGRYSK